MDTPVTRNLAVAAKRKAVPETATTTATPAPGPSLTSKVFPNVFFLCTILGAISLSWPLRWVLSGAPILVYTVLLGEAYGQRILPFVPIWTIFATVNLLYAVSATSWLLYWVFAACCWPTVLIASLFQFNAPGGLARRILRKTFLRDLHFINDQIAFFDLPALEIDTEVKGLFVVRGVTLSLSTMTLVAHGVEAGIKLSEDIELAIQTDKVVVPLFREIHVDDIYANVKGGDWEVTFGNVAYGKPEPTSDDDTFVASDTAILRAASVALDGTYPRRVSMVRQMTAEKQPDDAEDAESAFATVKKVSPGEKDANKKYKELVKNIHDTSVITNAKRAIREAVDADEKDTKLDLDNMDDFRAAICAHIHDTPSIPHPPKKSIRVSTLRKTDYPNVKAFLHRLPFLYRLMLSPLCYFHPVKFSSVTAAGSGKWFVSLMRQYLFKHYAGQDSEIRRLEARISAWCADANFAVELGPIASEASFPINTNYNIQCHFKMSDVLAYRAVPEAVELKQVVRLAGADAVLTIPTFLFPHHEHIFPVKRTDFQLMEMEEAIKLIAGTPKARQALKEYEKLKKDEASMHVSAHAHLPAQFHQDLLNFVAAIVKATKVIESDKSFEEAKVLRELKRVSAASGDSDVDSVASVDTTTTTNTNDTTTTVNSDKGFKNFLKKVDTGFKDASAKTMVGMRKAGANTVSAMANDRWIASLVGKITRKLEKAQGEVGYSGDVPIALDKYRVRHESLTKILP
ncbi:hypothetical protein HBI56_035780 [Parastagonospora nodorum]|nr:hypothetical protein HBH56_071020 [Parastagonospora nodorum]KAH3932656.1 hypothetical protein HBH54_077090 [Parastagonospora nodorum]KAH3986370.1 hypothetical protein HBH52_048420 [Parastagonospora nodorum]KAH3988048.1 hypothetical protein HBH51_000660 [Parastagonospora nodorum]KAH4004945.1 hypothetical protein HBI10_039160 [Parastagonospora nodorum]